MTGHLGEWASLTLVALRVTPTVALVARVSGAMRAPVVVAVAAVLALGLGVAPGAVPLDATLVLRGAREGVCGVALAAALAAPVLAMHEAGAWLGRPWSQGGVVGSLFAWTAAISALGIGAHRDALRTMRASFVAFPPSADAWTPSLASTTSVFASAMGAASNLGAAALLAACVVELVVAAAVRVAPALGVAELRITAREVALVVVAAAGAGAAPSAARALGVVLRGALAR